MSACDALTAIAALGAAPALRAIDCLANETTAAAFGRLFGTGGALLPALTILLTLYIAFFALSLLTGRSRIGIAALTPRMMTLGLVLTFATSWAAYQSVVWNLVIGAPDQIAGVLMGATGPATLIFADRIDIVFAAIAEAASSAGETQAPVTGSFTPGNLMWLAALLLLLGTVGVLVTARIALAVLLALGPVFVVFALFSGTRGLFVGWLRGVVLTAVTPLFVVIGGGLTIELLVPVIASLRSVDGIDGRSAMALFMAASVHLALMAMVLKVAGSIVSAWQVFGLAPGELRNGPSVLAEPLPGPAITGPLVAGQTQALRHRVALMPAVAISADIPGSITHLHTSRTGNPAAQLSGAAPGPSPHSARRRLGIGSRYSARPIPSREMIR
jgi:type IV secretion system protein VirB6